MKRKDFILGLSGATAFFTMDGFSSIVSAFNRKDHDSIIPELATFGPVHLNNTSLKKSIHFWTEVVGLQVRSSTEKVAELGTNSRTLVVVHETAEMEYASGYSGMYHFAIHAPDSKTFAKMLYRLFYNNYPCSPTDHIMSKSVYFSDPDGITIEIALETPERFRRVTTDKGLRMEDVHGNLHSASETLDVDSVLEELDDKDLYEVLPDGTRIGHIHLYANQVTQSNLFYKSLGFLEFNDLPQFQYADLGAGGNYQHRIAMNSWHGQNRPLAPANSAGLSHFQIIYNQKSAYDLALSKHPTAVKDIDGYRVFDPTGNLVLLSNYE